MIMHLLYGPGIKRGGEFRNLETGEKFGSDTLEIIEDLPPAPPAEIDLLCDRPVSAVRIVPEGKEVSFSQENGRIKFTAPAFECHQMIEISFK